MTIITLSCTSFECVADSDCYNTLKMHYIGFYKSNKENNKVINTLFNRIEPGNRKLLLKLKSFNNKKNQKYNLDILPTDYIPKPDEKNLYKELGVAFFTIDDAILLHRVIRKPTLEHLYIYVLMSFYVYDFQHGYMIYTSRVIAPLNTGIYKKTPERKAIELIRSNTYKKALRGMLPQLFGSIIKSKGFSDVLKMRCSLFDGVSIGEYYQANIGNIKLSNNNQSSLEYYYSKHNNHSIQKQQLLKLASYLTSKTMQKNGVGVIPARYKNSKEKDKGINKRLAEIILSKMNDYEKLTGRNQQNCKTMVGENKRIFDNMTCMKLPDANYLFPEPTFVLNNNISIHQTLKRSNIRRHLDSTFSIKNKFNLYVAEKFVKNKHLAKVCRRHGNKLTSKPITLYYRESYGGKKGILVNKTANPGAVDLFNIVFNSHTQNKQKIFKKNVRKSYFDINYYYDRRGKQCTKVLLTDGS
jgi:hypothetical protein